MRELIITSSAAPICIPIALPEYSSKKRGGPIIFLPGVYPYKLPKLEGGFVDFRSTGITEPFMRSLLSRQKAFTIIYLRLPNGERKANTGKTVFCRRRHRIFSHFIKLAREGAAGIFVHRDPSRQSRNELIPICSISFQSRASDKSRWISAAFSSTKGQIFQHPQPVSG